MAPRRKKSAVTAAAAAVSLSPRRTRSGAAGKRVAPPAAAPATAKAKTKKIRFAKEKSTEVKEKENGKAAPPTGDAKSIIVEACKQCKSFKTRAEKVKEDLESAVPGISVTINPEKPRRGCFEIREEGGDIFVSLLNMPRPFTPMKKLDMDELIQDIIKKIA